MTYARKMAEKALGMEGLRSPEAREAAYSALEGAHIEAVINEVIEACAREAEAHGECEMCDHEKIIAARIRFLASPAPTTGATAPTSDVKGALARLWSAYPVAGAARGELRLVFSLLGDEPPAEDEAPVAAPTGMRPGQRCVSLVDDCEIGYPHRWTSHGEDAWASPHQIRRPSDRCPYVEPPAPVGEATTCAAYCGQMFDAHDHVKEHAPGTGIDGIYIGDGKCWCSKACCVARRPLHPASPPTAPAADVPGYPGVPNLHLGAPPAAPVTPPTLADGQWHDVVTINDGKTERVFIDGKPVTPPTCATCGGNGSVWVGSGPPNPRKYSWWMRCVDCGGTGTTREGR